jgi:hypothetical protein
MSATWTSLGMAVGELFARSPGTLVAVALLALCLTALTVSLLRRPQTARRRIDSD